jgi:hypothetical protein
MEYKHPTLGGITARYKFGGDKPPSPKAPPPVAEPPTSTEAQSSMMSVRERLRRQKGYASTKTAASGPATLTRGTLG